jgi:phosphoglycerol transferase MdoB-like AlkP superfamily enzyme
MSVTQIIVVSLLIIGAAAFIVFLWFKAPKLKTPILNSAVMVLLVGITTFTVTAVGVKANALPNDFNNLVDAYSDYGFVYCFSLAIFENGIKMPDNYSEDEMLKLKDLLDKFDIYEFEQKNYFQIDNVPAAANPAQNKPNIIVVQLESFYDVNNLIAPKYAVTDNPIPNYTKLKEENMSGYLTVPYVGSGTAYTEFEVLTGINIDYFGPGECPYYTAINDTACDSGVYTLKNFGYATHAIHNNTADFYNRNNAYKNLGFDTFTSLEYMYDVDYTAYDWAKDYCLTPAITKTLDSTAGEDFVFAVSVQAHGRYPDDTETSAYNYYVEQLREVDDFIGQLIASLSERGEDTILVLYGDHQPALDFNADDSETGDLYQTDYVVWANYDIGSVSDRDLYTYDIFGEILNICGYEPNYIMKARDIKLPDSKIKLLAYDMLYGDNYLGFQLMPTDTIMGIDPINIDNVLYDDEYVYIKGNNFNKDSFVYINGDIKDVDSFTRDTITVKYKLPKGMNEIKVAQLSKTKTILSETNVFIID